MLKGERELVDGSSGRMVAAMALEKSGFVNSMDGVTCQVSCHQGKDLSGEPVLPYRDQFPCEEDVRSKDCSSTGAFMVGIRQYTVMENDSNLAGSCIAHVLRI